MMYGRLLCGSEIFFVDKNYTFGKDYRLNGLVDGMKNVDIVISMFICGRLSWTYFTKRDITRSHLTNSRRSYLHGAIPRRPIHISLNPTSIVHTQPIHAPTNHTPPIYTNPIHTPPVYSSRVSTLHPSKLKLKFYRSGF